MEGWDANDWANVISIGALLLSGLAWLAARRSAKSAEKQNELSLHQHRVGAYDTFVTEFSAGIYMQSSKMEERNKNLYNFSKSCMLIKFLFKHSTYTITDSFKLKFDKLVQLNDSIWSIDDELNDSPIGTTEEYIKNLQIEKLGHKKDLMKLRKEMLADFVECKKVLEDEITLYKPPQLNTTAFLFFPISLFWAWDAFKMKVMNVYRKYK